jgi:predicted RNase H-like HicB family nuclease
MGFHNLPVRGATGRENRYRVEAFGGNYMKLSKLTAVIEKEGEWCVATCPELGVASQGRDLDEAMIQEAVELLLEEADDDEVQRRLNRGVRVKELELAHA